MTFSKFCFKDENTKNRKKALRRWTGFFSPSECIIGLVKRIYTSSYIKFKKSDSFNIPIDKNDTIPNIIPIYTYTTYRQTVGDMYDNNLRRLFQKQNKWRISDGAYIKPKETGESTGRKKKPPKKKQRTANGRSRATALRKRFTFTLRF